MVFVEDVDAVADALGVAELDGFADVEAEAVGGDEAGGEFAGVERDVDLGVDASAGSRASAFRCGTRPWRRGGLRRGRS